MTEPQFVIPCLDLEANVAWFEELGFLMRLIMGFINWFKSTMSSKFIQVNKSSSSWSWSCVL